MRNKLTRPHFDSLCRRFGVQGEVLDAKQVAERYPMLYTADLEVSQSSLFSF